MSPLQLALPSDPLVSLEVALDPIERFPAFRRPVADNTVFPRRSIGDAGRTAKADRLADSEFVLVHAVLALERVATGRPADCGPGNGP